MISTGWLFFFQVELYKKTHLLNYYYTGVIMPEVIILSHVLFPMVFRTFRAGKNIAYLGPPREAASCLRRKMGLVPREPQD